MDGFTAFALEAVEEGCFEEESFAKLYELEPEDFWFRSRSKLLVWALRKYFPDATSLLEIGCGTGFVLSCIQEAVPSLQLTGAELFPAGLSFAQRRVPSATFVQLDATNLPYRKEFDVIGAFDVLEHIPDDVAAFREISNGVRTGGGVIITVPQHQWMWSPADDFAQHQRRYTRRTLVKRIQSAGLEPLFVTSFVSGLLPLMWLSRNLSRGKSTENFDPIEEFHRSRKIRTPLEAVMSLERKLIQSGVRFPVGGSLLAIARRT